MFHTCSTFGSVKQQMAILASDFIKCNKVIGLHYDTFGYIKIDQEEAVRKFKEKGKELILLKIGETIEV